MSEQNRINDMLDGSPWWSALSSLGRRAFFPLGVPFQAGEARGKRYNATIGQITGDDGSPYPLASMAQALDPLNRRQAFLYSPVGGHPDLRSAWRDRLLAEATDATGSAPDLHDPHITIGLSHGLSICADLFLDPGDPIVFMAPFWGNYRQIFGVRRQAELRECPFFSSAGLNFDALEEMLSDGTGKITVVCNFPSNPTGYSPTVEERARLTELLVRTARKRPVVAIVDDAYHDLVFEDVPKASLFWDLIEAGRTTTNLLPIKVDGATKEFGFFSGRVGFLTFGVARGAVTEALLSKVSCLLRSTVGSPVGPSQAALLAALRSPTLKQERADLLLLLKARYETLKESLAKVDGAFTVLPFNSGCFALIELPDGVDGEALRRHLLDVEETGVIRVTPRHVRLAFCSVPRDDISELVQRLARGCSALLSGS